MEEDMIEALKKWLDNENISSEDAGNVVAELIILHLRHHRFLEMLLNWCYIWVVELQIRTWTSFSTYCTRYTSDFDWHSTDENECAGLVLVQHSSSHFLANQSKPGNTRLSTHS